MKLNPPNAHRSQIKICEKRQTRILKPILKSSKRIRVFRNTVANMVAKNQTRLAYEDKRDLNCTFHALQVSPGKAPTFRAPLYLARSPHLRRPQGFGNLPIGRHDLWIFPTRQTVSSLWSPECLLPNSQLGRVSPYSYEA